MESRYNKTSGLEVRSAEDGSPIISGLGIVYNKLSQDLGGFVERIDPAAANKTVGDGAGSVYASFNHDPNHVLGRVSAGTLRLTNGADGLRYDIDPALDSPFAMHVLSAVKRGDVAGSSFTFSLAGAADTWDVLPDGRAMRTINELRLYELGPVVSPAYLDTTSQARSVLAPLAASRGLDLEEVVRCAQEGALAQIVTHVAETSDEVRDLGTSVDVTAEEPGNHSSQERMAAARARLELARRRR